MQSCSTLLLYLDLKPLPETLECCSSSRCPTLQNCLGFLGQALMCSCYMHSGQSILTYLPLPHSMLPTITAISSVTPKRARLTEGLRQYDKKLRFSRAASF